MNLKDELHDLRLVGWKDYWWLAVGMRLEDRRSQRRDQRLMKTSTYDALLERVDPGLVPENLEQEIHEDLLADTIAVERRRWIERAQWIVMLLVFAGLGYTAGFWWHEESEPGPWDCTVAVSPEASLIDPTIMRCVGGEGEENPGA